jgi:hypothetical protein
MPCRSSKSHRMNEMYINVSVQFAMNEAAQLPFPGFVTFGINLTVFDDTLSTERCQKEPKEPEVSSVMVGVCYREFQIDSKGFI